MSDGSSGVSGVVAMGLAEVTVRKNVAVASNDFKFKLAIVCVNNRRSPGQNKLGLEKVGDVAKHNFIRSVGHQSSRRLIVAMLLCGV